MFLSTIIYANAQQKEIYSLKNLISNTKKDTAKIDLYEKLGEVYRNERKLDSSILSYQQALEINEKYNYSMQKQCWDVAALDYILYEMGNYSESLKYALRHLALSEKLNDTAHNGFSHLVFGHDYRELGEYRQSLNHYFKAKEFFKLFWISRNKPEDNTYTMLCISETYLKMNNLDSALIYSEQAYKLAVTDSVGGLILLSTRIVGDIYFAGGDDETALRYYRQYIPDFVKYKERNRDLGFVLNSMSKIFQKRGQPDSAIFYAKKAFANAQQYQDQENLFNAAMLLSNYYKEKNDHAAYSYLKIAVQAKDSMMSSDKIKQTQILSYNEQVREKEKQEADAKEAAKIRLIIIISAILISIISFLIWNRLRQLRLRYKMILEQKEAEKLKARYEKELLGLEARALRAQMNPHFVFNCLNSIKALMQDNENEKGVTYLTTFSKLIRTLFNNADKKEINLYDEIETCKLYLQLEAMRFGTKFSYSVNVDENIDLKSIQVPALIIQPFIENAIWHGIVPRNSGGHVSLNVVKKDVIIEVIIDDNGIGREASQQNKSASGLTHKSKGVNLTQSRLELNNLLQQRQAKLEVIDKKDENGMAIGTTVIIKIREELS
jgi:anti-sigma regulatory factor (Ser/Thr protein kinase)